MTVRVSVRIEPVDSTGSVELIVKGKDEEKFKSTFDLIAPIESPVMEVGPGDTLTVKVKTGKKIVYDAGQGTVSLEDAEAEGAGAPLAAESKADPHNTKRGTTK